MSDLEQLARDLNTSSRRTLNRINGRMVRAQRELLGVARSVVHVKSGDLRDSLAIEPPDYIGVGISEFSVSATVSYAPYEVARGGAHDYVVQTLEDGAAIIDQTVSDLADIVAEGAIGQ